MGTTLLLCLASAQLLASAPSAVIRPSEEPASRPFAVEYYYKIKWGHFEEWMDLYKRNHYPVLVRIQEMGDIVEMRAAYPINHASEDSRWDFRFTIVWKDAETAHAEADRTPILEELYPDKEKFLKEEQRRFQLLLAHTDVPVRKEDFTGW